MSRALWPLCVGVVLSALQAGAYAADEPTLALTISKRDTLIGLSRRVLIEPAAWREVAALNRLRNPDVLVSGQVLQVPLRLLRWTPADARLASTSGDVRIDGKAAAALDTVREGQAVETGADGSAVLELADQSRIKLAPSSLAEVLAARRHANSADAVSGTSDGLFAGALRLLRGSVEVFATKVLRAKPLEVSTPTAVAGVRGTQYRVGYDAAPDRSSRVEVIEGKVRFDAATVAGGADVAAGFGASVDARSSVPVVARLLDAPDLSAAPQRFERPIVRFTLAQETQPLRIQVAADPAFDRMVRDLRIDAGAEVRIAGLDDGAWHLRARRIDPRGVEGFDATRPFVLKARPEPPAPAQPRRGAKQTVGTVEFAWAQNVEARSQRLQVARDAAFSDVVIDRDALPGATVAIDLPAPGMYFWRLASVRGDNDLGPFGDPLPFELRPTPQPPQGGLAGDGTSLVFNWPGRPQDRQQVQLARDPAFADIVASAELDAAEWVLPRPERAGDYFFRYRSVEPDGFVSPYSATLKTVVPKDWSFLWFLVPLLFTL